MNFGELRLLGPGTVSGGYAAGFGFVSATFGTGSIRATIATISLSGQAFIPLVPIDQASTSTTAAAIGGTVTGTLEGSANLLGGLMLGTTQPPTVLGGIGEELWLSPFAFMTIGVLGAPLTFTATVPNDPTLRGALFGWQGMTWEPTAGFVFSNPAWFGVE